MSIFQDIVRNVLSFSSDAVVILALFAGATAFGLFFGKHKLVSIILTFYPTALIFRSIPYFKKILSTTPLTFSEAFAQIAVFFAVFIPIYFILSHFISTEFSFSRIRKVIEACLLGFVATVLAIFSSYHIINLQKIYNFSTGIDSLFLSSTVFWWLLAPFVALFFLRK